MMENALDTLKTAFPYPEPLSPTEELEGDADGRTLDSRKYRSELYISTLFPILFEVWHLNNKPGSFVTANRLMIFLLCGHVWFCVSCIRRLMFPSKISPSLNIPDLHPKVTYCFSEGSTVSDHIVFAISDLKKDVFKTDTWHVALLIFRSSMACRCLVWRALSKSRKDFYVSQMGKRQPSRAGNSRRHRGKLMAQVHIHINVFLVSFILNERINQPAVTQLHHLGAAELHWLFGHLLNIPCSHFPLYDVFCLYSMSCHVF